MNVKSSDKA
ncbi:hypothetical protein VTN00DRAFT_2539 [Thermoascus crustaceus]